MVEEIKRQRSAALTKHLRLLVYSFLPAEVMLKSISILSKKERESLLSGSSIAQKGKSH